MSSSLRDQLIQAGLATAKQAREARAPKRPPSRHQPAQPSEEQRAAAQAQAAKSARDQELNRRHQEKLAAKARRAEARQLIEQSMLPKVESEEYFNFCDGSTLQRIPVNGSLRGQLVRGEVLIVRYRTHYALVPAAAIARIRERDEHAVVSFTAAPRAATDGATADASDPYKDFVVPDDLIW